MESWGFVLLGGWWSKGFDFSHFQVWLEARCGDLKYGVKIAYSFPIKIYEHFQFKNAEI